MTGPAGDMNLPVAELRVDLGLPAQSSGRPSASQAWCRVSGPPREVAAPLVLDAERGRKGLHLSHEVLRRQYFEILRRTISASALTLGVKANLRDVTIMAARIAVETSI